MFLLLPLLVVEPAASSDCSSLDDASISWVAQRVPDDHVAVVANMYTIREVDLDDTFNFLGRQDMWDLALADGLWDSSMSKDFTRTFSDGVSEQEFRPKTPQIRVCVCVCVCVCININEHVFQR